MKNIWRIEFLSDLFDCIGCDEESLEKAIEEKDKYYGGKISIPKKNGYSQPYFYTLFLYLCRTDKLICFAVHLSWSNPFLSYLSIYLSS